MRVKMPDTKNKYRRNKPLSYLYFLVILVLFLQFSWGKSKPEKDLQKYLPQKINNKWQTAGEPQSYKNEDLYLYINGGAAIYHEYGFRVVLVQDYTNKNEGTISLEIYEMADSTAAYGIYSFKRSSAGEDFAVDKRGRLEDYYLNFWKGKYLVTLTGFDEEAETIQGLIDIATTVSSRLDGKSELPALVGLLPDKGLIKPSIKYFMGNLGLMNIFRGFSEQFTAFTEGVKADDDTGASTFIFKYEDSTESHNIFHSARAKFKKSAAYTQFSSIDDSSFHVTAEKKKLIHIRVYQEYILAVLGDSLEKSLKIIDSIEDKIE